MTATGMGSTVGHRISPRRTLARALPYAVVATLAALTLAACGSGGGTTTGGGAPAASTAAPTTTGGAGGRGQRQPGVSGLVAAVNGSTMQVQTRTDQTAVTWTGTTTFRKVAAATRSDLTVGSCVTVVAVPTTGTTTPGSGPAALQLTAATVQVRPARKAGCGGGPGGVAGRGAAGAVTALDAGTMTVQETSPATPQETGTTTTGPATGTPTPRTVTVLTTPSTTYLAEQPATASDVAVGECATALGTADDTGAVTATAITLRPAANGSCTAASTGRRAATGTATTGGLSNG